MRPTWGICFCVQPQGFQNKIDYPAFKKLWKKLVEYKVASLISIMYTPSPNESLWILINSAFKLLMNPL